jgi:photosystem II stability/assembly factor-like uncharacterized protein
MSTIPQMRVIKSLVPAAAACLLAFVVGCSSDEGTTPVGPPPIYSSIVITGPDTVLIGGTAAFSATVIDTGGNPVPLPSLTFVSSATGVATVNNAGTAQGVSEGNATIQASGGGVYSNVRPLAVLQGYGWVDQSSAALTISNLRGVTFITAREGWIVGALGTILHTKDAGKTWSPQVSGSTGYTLNAVSFVSATTGVAVGSAGRILRTVNGGTTWSAITASTGGSALNDVYFQDTLTGWIVGNGGVILRSTNSGSTWTRILPSPTTTDLERVSFPRYTFGTNPPSDPYGFGWIVGAGGTILSTGDFGLTWSLITPFVTTDPLFGVSRRDEAHAIAVGSSTRVLGSYASGPDILWQLLPAPSPLTNFTAVSWSPESPLPGSAWAVGKQSSGPATAVVFRSDDGGGTWTPQFLPGTAPLTGNALEDVYFVDDDHGWAVGGQGLILHTATGGR